jgi:hypothetical protein
MRLEGDQGLRPVGGTYLIGVLGRTGWRLLSIGQTNNLSEKDWAAALAEVRHSAPAAEILIRLNVNRGDREAEVDDLNGLVAEH